MDLSVIVVNYNTKKLLEDCLLSLEKHLEGRLDYEMVVVDNASADGSAEWLAAFRQEHPRVQTLLSKENLGFAAGNNAGLRLARGRNVLLLNSDAYLIDDSLLKACAYLDAHGDVGCVTALLLDGQGKPGPSYGHFPHAATLAREVFKKGNFSKLRAVCPPESEPTHDIDFPCGAYLLARRALLEELGGFDEAFWMYFEETDLARRMKDKGLRNVYLAEARAVHLGGQSAVLEVKSLHLTRMFYTNWKRYLLKHHGALNSLAVSIMLRAYYRLAAAVYARRGNTKVSEYFRTHARCAAEGWKASIKAARS